MVGCPRCSKQVYFAEEVRAIGKAWHKSCLTCAKCNKRLDSTRLREHDNDIYCMSCHGRSFGPKGYGFAGGAAGLSMDTGVAHHVTRQNVPVGLTVAQVPKLIKSEPSLPESRNTCPVCNKQVYMAEKVTGPSSQSYHKLCFKCTDCNSLLDSTRMAHHQHTIYCKACYNKRHGPKGFGYGQAMQRTT